MSRVEPNRKWFGNTRVISQAVLQNFQEEIKKVKTDPYSVIMRQTKLPVSLLNETQKYKRIHILDTESYASTFGRKAQRKRPKLKTGDIEGLAVEAEKSTEMYEKDKDLDLVLEDPGFIPEQPEMIFKAGQSKRVWNELYKVVDSADVLAQVLDARDPQGTRSNHLENYLKKEKPHKQLIFVLNKCDLVPTWVTQKWVAILSSEYPTMAFRANIKNNFGKGAMITLLRQFAKLHSDKKQISVGFIGYPNVGKSSIINTLMSKKTCKVAPIAGETKVWQYVTLTRRIYLIDCPGVVYPVGNTETETVLKGVVRIENIKSPEDHIPAVCERVKKEALLKTYGIDDFENSEDFLEKICHRNGRLLKKGQPDIGTVARMVLNDFQRGRLPFYVRPPETEIDGEKDKKITTTVDQADNSVEPNDVDDKVNSESDVNNKVNSEINNQVNSEINNQVISAVNDEAKEKKKGGRKRKRDKNETEKKPSGKEKRRKYNEEKVKKTGSNFYEVANVKNRRRNR